jgi:beta-phosphoglucomutase-like phosphatase (HAD superfamily)
MTASSSFGEEFHNITFPNEAQAALAAFRAYNTYLQDDAHLRSMPLDTQAGIKAAIDFDTDADTPGTSDQAFNAYSKALGDVIALNEAQFESALPAAENGIGTWTWLPYLLAVLLIGLTVLGLRPRLNEYR